MLGYINLILKGAAIGIANVIPGVSGGTIAFITGVYERLISSLSSFAEAEFLMYLRRGALLRAWRYVDGMFLTLICGGAIVAIIAFAGLVKRWYVEFPIELFAFFFGLIAFSIFSVGRMIKGWSIGTIFIFILGLVLALGISFLKPAGESENLVYLVLCGALAMMAMVVPGLSGSFVLLLLGNYLMVMGAIAEMQLRILVPVGIGAVVGLLLFSRVLSWVFKKYRNMTVAILSGFVAGSLLMIWPWKVELPMITRDGEVIVKSKKEEDADFLFRGKKIFRYKKSKRLIEKVGSVHDEPLVWEGVRLMGIQKADGEVVELREGERIIASGYEWFLPKFGIENHRLVVAIILMIFGSSIAFLTEFVWGGRKSDKECS